MFESAPDWNHTEHQEPPSLPPPAAPILIRIPRPNNPPPPTVDMPIATRRSSRISPSESGSEYRDEKSEEDTHMYDEAEEPIPEYTTTKHGRRVQRKSYKESEDDMDLFTHPDDDIKPVNAIGGMDGDDEDDDPQPIRRTRRTRNLQDFVEEDEDEEEQGNHEYGRRLRSRDKKPPKPTRQPPITNGSSSSKPKRSSGPSEREQRMRRRLQQQRAKEENDVYIEESSNHSADADGSFDDAPQTSSDVEPPEPEVEQEPDNDNDGRPYSLRQRQKINYAIPPPLEEVTKPPKGRARNGGSRKPRLNWNMSGADLGRLLGEKPAPGGNDSDSDYGRSPRKAMPATGGAGGAFAGAGMMPGDLAAITGTPSNMGKIGDAALADADPLGVNMNVTFNEVGGLDDHIHQLKEMTLLPLLYPDVFQKFNVTPPRGVLFHGPPGTGKTLLARALAASCRSDGKQISFFMRKGADCLSKWVGEAERQLRLLFEEARNSQPSIIFFDEIDGLAPVRSSKQDQIHASIVSTLLALMDGMDGRGQVVVIGATNRPDAVDPALRRPGRFDREFYFPLPSVEAREKILGIMTKGWQGWGEEEESKSNIAGLAKMTKGYGGADLRALCTEAALNAIQRRYPQIYKSNDRLLLAPETIQVGLRDFMISIKKLVPSSARSSASSATPLPPQFQGLLSESLEQAKAVVEQVLPKDKKRTALEEAEFEDDGSLEKELLLQSMETLRIYRPRVILHGQPGMGQVYVGAALLHHMEGYHVQSLELGALMGDSARTVEAAIVQLFVEAKRHQPSIVYIPSLLGWCAAVSEVSRSTVKAMLDTLAPTDPILLLAVLDGNFSDLPRDVKAWFGSTRSNRVMFKTPLPANRSAFFHDLLTDIRRPPNEFPDGIQRRKRVLEELPIAPPLEPRKPTERELALQQERDHQLILILQSRLILIVNDLKKKFKRFTKSATEEYNFDPDEMMFPAIQTPAAAPPEAQPAATNGDTHMVNGDAQVEVVAIEGQEIQPPPTNSPPQASPIAQQEEAAPPPLPLFDVDLEKISFDIYQGTYLTPDDFLCDVDRIVHNARVRAVDDMDRYHRAEALRVAAKVSIADIDPYTKLECDRMAAREKSRREERRKKKGKDKEVPKEGLTGLRRSARQNGPVKMVISDPVALERQLKRRRSAEAGDGSGTSEGEQAAKRSKVSDDGEGDNGAGQPQESAPEASTSMNHSVRFAQDDLVDYHTMSPLGHHSRLPEALPDVGPPPSLPSIGGALMEVGPHPTSSTGTGGGFDSSLLNPAPGSVGDPNAMATSTPNTFAPAPQTLFSAPPLPTAQPLFPVYSAGEVAPSLAPVPNADLPGQPFQQPSQEATQVDEPTPAPDHPMQVERTPTPPLPEFHVDESRISKLDYALVEKTHAFNVEQLEQLRAGCLGAIWRHRKEWNRDQLVDELIGIVNEFVDEVNEDADDSTAMD